MSLFRRLYVKDYRYCVKFITNADTRCCVPKLTGNKGLIICQFIGFEASILTFIIVFSRSPLRISPFKMIRASIVGCYFWTACAIADVPPVTIGILSYRSLENTGRQWSGLAEYLQRNIPDRQFRILPLYFPDLDQAANSGSVDFVLTNPEHYVMLRQTAGLTAMLTLMPMIEGHPVNQFGGAIVAASRRSDLQTLNDLNGKVIASPARESFGGFMVQYWELYKQGIQVKDFHFTGMPHDQAVELVLKGDADAAFVRTGVLEAMIKEGKLAGNSIKVINRQNQDGFPHQLSSGLYPEWPFASLRHTDSALSKKVALALLNLDHHSPVARSAEIFGFSPPGDYSKVEAIMLNLELHPEALKNINLLDVYYRYRHPIWVALVAMLVIAMLSVKVLRAHRHLRRTYLKYHLVADYTSDWEYWIGPDGKVVYMSPSCENVTGYAVDVFKNQPELLERIIHHEDRPRFLRHLQSEARCQLPGELEFRILDKDNNLRWIHHLCRPVFDRKQRYQGIRVSNRDITARKRIEMELRLHDAALKACADAIIITDRNGMIKWVNPAFCSLTGYSENEALGKRPGELVKSGLQDAGFYQGLWQTILSGQSWRGEIVNRRKSGEHYHEQLSITPVFCEDPDVCHFIAVKQDISQRKNIELQIHSMAFFDPLTQLANRRLLIDRLEHAIAGCRRHRLYGALLFIDLDRFKPLNDEHGHDAGDALLVEVAHRLKNNVREQDTVARLGGDEFVILLTELGCDEAEAGRLAKQIAEKVHRVLGAQYCLNNHGISGKFEYGLSASVGISLFLDSEDDADIILKQADIAMYQVKNQGRDAIRFYAELPG